MRLVSLVASTIVLLVGLGATAPTATAAPEDAEVLSAWLVKPTNDVTLAAIADRFEIVHRHGDRYEIYVPASQRDAFLAMAPTAELIDADIGASLRAQLAESPEFFATYRSPAEVEALLNRLVTEHPEIAKLERYGTSERGRPLQVLKLSDNVAVDEAEPELMITAATHGDEIITVEVLLTLIEELVAGYGKDARLSAMINGHELFFIPTVNADGFATRTRYAGGVDPNRDYPWPETPNRTSTACIRDVMAFFHSRNIVGAIDLHAFGRMLMYPWAYTLDPADADGVRALDDLGQHMAGENNYTVGPISKVIYVAKGSSADYYYWKKGTLAYGIEVAGSKAPPARDIPRIVTEAREMTWRFIENF